MPVVRNTILVAALSSVLAQGATPVQPTVLFGIEGTTDAMGQSQPLRLNGDRWGRNLVSRSQDVVIWHDDRSYAEFDMTGLPPSPQTVTFDVYIRPLVDVPSNYVSRCDVYGYVADGIPSILDYDAGVPVGVIDFGPGAGLGGNASVDVTSFLGSLSQSGAAYAGFCLKINNLEWGILGTVLESRPVLTVVPEPTVGLALALLSACVLSRRGVSAQQRRSLCKEHGLDRDW